MSPFGQFALAAAMAALTGCASAQTSRQPDQISVADILTSITSKQVAPLFVSDFDVMRAALPAFDLQRNVADGGREVSVVRDLAFVTETSILSRDDVVKLLPLQVYLRANPLIDVRIEGYGDDVGSSERNDDLSMGRAQAVARALLTDIYIKNNVTTMIAKTPQSKGRSGRAEIFFIEP